MALGVNDLPNRPTVNLFSTCSLSAVTSYYKVESSGNHLQGVFFFLLGFCIFVLSENGPSKCSVKCLSPPRQSSDNSNGSQPVWPVNSVQFCWHTGQRWWRLSHLPLTGGDCWCGTLAAGSFRPALGRWLKKPAVLGPKNYGLFLILPPCCHILNCSCVPVWQATRNSFKNQRRNDLAGNEKCSLFTFYTEYSGL